jgi:hypothetical protein
MRKSIFVILFAVAFASPALAGEASCSFGSKCYAYKHARSTGPVAYSGPTICITYKQAKIDNIVIRFYDAAGKELDANDPLHNLKNAPTIGTICPGAHWFQEAARAELCNSFEGRWLESEHLAILLQLKGMPVGKFVYLDKPRS